MFLILPLDNNFRKAKQFKYRMGGKRWEYADTSEWAKIVGDPKRFSQVIEWHPPKGYGEGAAGRRKAEKFIASKVNNARAAARNASGVTSDKFSPFDTPLIVPEDPLPVIPLGSSEISGIQVIQDRVANWSRKKEGFENIPSAKLTGLRDIGIDPATRPMSYLLSVGWRRNEATENYNKFNDSKINIFTPKEIAALYHEFEGVIGRIAYGKNTRRAISQTSLESDDLRQVGFEALVSAAKRFQGDSGNFQSFAIGAIENNIKATIRRARDISSEGGEELLFHEDFDSSGSRVTPPRTLSPEQVSVMHRQSAYLMENIRSHLSKQEYGVLTLYWDLGNSAIFDEEVSTFDQKPREKTHNAPSERLGGTKRSYTFRTFDEVAELMHRNNFEGFSGESGRKKSRKLYDDAVEKIVNTFDETDVAILREFAFTSHQLATGNWRLPSSTEALTQAGHAEGSQSKWPKRDLITGENRAKWIAGMSTSTIKFKREKEKKQ